MMSNKILLVGGGGHCRSVLDSLLKSNDYSEIGIIDVKKNIGKTVLGYSVIGSDNELGRLYEYGFQYAFVTVGSIDNPDIRINLFHMIHKIGFKIPNIIDSTAVISDFAILESGIFVGKNAIINAGSKIHDGVIINSGAIIEHDCTIGAFTHIAPGSIICGEVQVGDKTFIGANCVIKQQLTIGADSIIGQGSVVNKNIKDSIIAYGNPCYEVRSRYE